VSSVYTCALPTLWNPLWIRHWCFITQSFILSEWTSSKIFSFTSRQCMYHHLLSFNTVIYSVSKMPGPWGKHQQRCWNSRYTAVRIRWHMHRNQILSFGEMDELMWLGRGDSSVDYWQPTCVGQHLDCAGEAMLHSLARHAGYPNHSPVAPSLPLPCIAVCYIILMVLY
jgi:hypothetical protein